MNPNKFVEIERKLIEGYLVDIENKPLFYAQVMEHEIAMGHYPSAAKTMPELWELIIHIGRHAPSDIKLEHVLSLDDEIIAKNMDHDPYLHAIKEAEILPLLATNYCDFVEYIPGASEYVQETENPHNDREKEQLLFNFLMSAPGNILISSIQHAKELDVLGNFIKSITDPNFVYALCELALQDLSLNPREWLIKEKATTDDEAYFKLLEEVLHRCNMEEQKKLITSANSNRRSSSRKSKEPSAPEIIKLHWLPMSLWKKTTDEILGELPSLQSGSLEANYTKDCNNIETAIRRLGLSRFQ